MADEAQRFTARTGSLQSRIANSKNAKQQQAASSSAAAKSGSTTTPTITSTPKVTNTAKAMPSVTRVDISKLSVPTVTPTVTTPREQAMNLLGSKTRVEPLKKAEVPDMLNGQAQPTGIAGALNKWLYEIPQKITQEFGETVKESNLFEKGKNLIIDTARFGISTAQGLLERYGTTDLPVGGQTLNNSEMGTRIKEQRNNTLKTIFDELESRDQWLSKREGYQESKEEAEKWAESGKGIRQALQESNWDVVITRAGEIVAQMIPAFATAIITKNPKIAAGTVFTTVYGDAYKRNLTDVVKDPDFKDLTGQQKTDLASLLATTEATIETLGDMLELAPFMKGKTSISKMLGIKNALASFVANWQGSAITEGLEEVSTEALQTWLKQAYGSLDEVSLKELGQIFSDTYLLMQIAGLGGGAGGVVETRNRNEAEKILEQEAKKFNNFNDFEAAAQRGGVEDNSIIQDAWAKAKGLTKEQSQTIKYDVKYVEKQEEETTKLYEEKESVENKLESLRESGEEKNKTQISKLETRLQEIDNQINEIDKSIQEYMSIYGEELPVTPEQSEGGTVSMTDNSVASSKPIDDMSDDELLSARAYWLKNKPTTPQERRRNKDIQNEIKSRENNVVLSDEIKQALADLSFDVEGLSEIEAKAIINELSRLMGASDNIDMRNKYYEMMIKVRSKAKELSEREGGETTTEERDNPSILPETEIDDTLFYNKAGRGVGLDQYAFRIYYQDRKHIPGLRGIKVAGLENLSDAEIMEIARSAAIVAGTLGIDFNKILENAHFSVLSLKGEEVRGAEGISGRLNTQMNRMMPDILQLAIILKDTGPSVFGHELMHLLDKEYLFKNNKLWTRGGNLSRSSLLKDPKFKTYNKPYEGYKYDDNNYWDTSREILARYAEQYVAFKNDKREYDAYTGKNFYRSDAEFKKLIGRFESLLSNFSDFALETSDREVYPEIVKKMAELQYSQTQFGLGTETEIVYKLADMKGQYDEIVAEIEKVKNETLRIELETEASNLYSNFEMLNKMGENYTQIQKTTNELQNLMDSITTEVIPTPPQSPETIKNGLPQLGGSNIEKGIDEISKGESPDESFMKSYMTETQKIKINNRKNKIKTFRKELGQTMKDLFTPTLSRIYNISPRVAGRLITMETQTEINIHKYRQRAKGFVETLGKLKGKDALEVKMALLDYGALASEQTEDTIEEYKKEEVAKLKEVLKRNGFKEKDINDMFYVLNDIGQQYKDAGLDIALTDLYFPRVVKDYEGLIDYMNRVSGQDIKVNKTSLLIKIRQIQEDPDMTDEEKERRIRNAISIEFKQPGTTSKHGKERKLGLLSEWGPGIYAYYENPIQSLDHYIVTMTNAIQRQLFLGGMVEDANITESEILNRNTSESVSTIIGRLVELGMVNEEDVNELQKSILAVLNKKPSPKSVTAIKDITYIATITNFLSAINQLDDLGMVILRDRSGLKHIAKTIFGRAGIKYDDLGLEDSYEMFREEGSITNWLFKKSFFNTFDRLGKTSFVNTAWESMVRQSKNEKTRKYLYSRLVAMYGRESADRMMDKINRNDYRGEDGQIDIEILRDLLYQLGSTQPIYTSAMSTTYLNNPRARLCYALSSFTLKRIDWLIQGTKEVNAKHGAIAAGAWVMGVSSFLAMFGAVIGDLGDLLKGDKEETFLWKFINEGIEEALKSGGSDALDSWLKIWDLSEYDIKTYKQQGLWGVFSAKIKPFVFDLGKDITQAITEGDEDEITDLAKYVPIFGKLVYYWLWDDLESSTDELLDLGEDLDLDLGEDLDLDLDGELLDL